MIDLNCAKNLILRRFVKFAKLDQYEWWQWCNEVNRWYFREKGRPLEVVNPPGGLLFTE